MSPNLRSGGNEEAGHEHLDASFQRQVSARQVAWSFPPEGIGRITFVPLSRIMRWRELRQMLRAWCVRWLWP